MANTPFLGLATTEEMLREVIARLSQEPVNFQRALTLAELLGGMSAYDKEYRTVDGG